MSVDVGWICNQHLLFHFFAQNIEKISLVTKTSFLGRLVSCKSSELVAEWLTLQNKESLGRGLVGSVCALSEPRAVQWEVITTAEHWHLRERQPESCWEIEQYSRGFSISTARSIVNWIRNYLLESQGNHFHRAANEMGNGAAEKKGNSQFSTLFLFNSTEYEREKPECLFAVKKKVQRFCSKSSFWGQSEGHPNCEPSFSQIDADQMSSNLLFAFTFSDSPCNRLLSMLKWIHFSGDHNKVARNFCGFRGRDFNMYRKNVTIQIEFAICQLSIFSLATPVSRRNGMSGHSQIPNWRNQMDG